MVASHDSANAPGDINIGEDAEDVEDSREDNVVV